MFVFNNIAVVAAMVVGMAMNVVSGFSGSKNTTKTTGKMLRKNGLSSKSSADK